MGSYDSSPSAQDFVSHRLALLSIAANKSLERAVCFANVVQERSGKIERSQLASQLIYVELER